MANRSLALAQGIGPVDEGRLAAAVRQHLDLVWRVLRRLGVPEVEAEDAAQHAFLTLARRLEEVPAGSERAFLAEVAVRLAASTRRRLARRAEELTECFDDVEALADNPEDLLVQRRGRELLDAVLAELDESLAAVLVLYELEGLSITETATALGVPRGTVSSRLRRARDELEARLHRHLSRPLRRGGQP